MARTFVRAAVVAACFFPVFVLLWIAPSAPAAGGALSVHLGEPFPDMEFPGLLEPGDYAALGLARTRGPVRLSELPGDLLVLEFFNRFCLTCIRQAPYLAKVWETVRAGDLRGRVYVLGVGTGNRPKGLRRFRQETGASYPLAPDPSFDRFLELGDPGGTPFTVFLVRRAGSWVLADYHLGLQGDTEILARVRVLLEGRARVKQPAGEPPQPKVYHPPLGLTEEEQRIRAEALLRRVAGRPVRAEPVDVAGSRVFRAVDPEGRPLNLFVRIVSREPVCDVCHAIHFLLAFDGAGRIRGFEPVYVTKFGNELWSPEDVARMASRLVGRPMEELAFDPDVDAVTSATMSSALIFDEARRTARLLPLLEGR